MRWCIQFLGDVGVTEAVKPAADSDVMCIAIGVGVCVALLVLVTTTVAVAVWCLVKKKRSKSGMYYILHGLK